MIHGEKSIPEPLPLLHFVTELWCVLDSLFFFFLLHVVVVGVVIVVVGVVMSLASAAALDE